MGKILTASTHPGSANATLPVICELRKRGHEVVSYATGPAQKNFDRDNAPYNLFGDLTYDVVRKAVDLVRPDFVLTGVAFQEKEKFPYTAEQLATLSAVRGKIPSLNITDFWDTDWAKRFRDIHSGREFIYLPRMLTAIDETSKQEMLEQGIPISADYIFATGNPNFDQWAVRSAKFSEADKKRVKTELGFSPDSRLIVYANQGIESESGNKWGYTEKTGLYDLLRGLKSLPKDLKLALLIKQHPRHSLEELSQNVEEFRRAEGLEIPTSVNKEYSTMDAIMAAELAVSHFSTVLVESALAGTPAISLQPGLVDIGADLLRTNKYGLTIPVYEAGKCGALMKTILTDSSFAQEFQEKRKGFTDGKATQRVADVVEQNLR